jgi:heme/copper-type cytochrome/quinol oxidase subunit 3
MWWGAVLLVAIESTMMGLALVSYFYLRGNYDVWPPSGVGDAAFRWGAAATAVTVGSLLPNLMLARAARRGDVRAGRLNLLLTTLLGAGALWLRSRELASVPFRWDTHAYGSLYWITLGLHTFHIVTGMIENVLLLTLLYRGPIEKKRVEDMEASSILWAMVGLEWIPGFLVLYLDPIFLAR